MAVRAVTTQLRKEILYSLSLVPGDDVVAYKHGEKSAQNLSSAGFRNLTFRTYNGYLIDFCLKIKTTTFFSFPISFNSAMQAWPLYNP